MLSTNAAFMVLHKDKEDGAVTSHSFEVAGQQLKISCDGWSLADGWVAAEVTFADAEPVTVGGFNIADDETARSLTEEHAHWLREDGTLRPPFGREMSQIAGHITTRAKFRNSANSLN